MQKFDKKAVGLVGPDSKSVKFENENGAKISVYEYFEKEFKTQIEHDSLPLLHIGNVKATCYVPLEMVTLKAQVNCTEVVE